MSVAPVAVTLAVAPGGPAQQRLLDAWLDARRTCADDRSVAVLAEGAMFDLHAPPGVPLARLAAGCPCCLGLLPLRVTLARLLRAHRPRAVLLLVATAAHGDRLRQRLEEDSFGVPLVVRRIEEASADALQGTGQRH